ncbi:MAG: exosortase/archaeosortase family protein [Candidatus Zixiibacteriota bacterium]
MTDNTQPAARQNLFYFLLGLLVLIYIPALIDLVRDWYHDANYSHGFLVPLISFYLIWKNRAELSKIEARPNRFGLAVIIIGIILFILGNGASEYFTVRFSLVVTLFGIILYHLGSEFIRKSWFAVLFLVFMIPIPYVVYFSATFPMQLLASKVSSVLLNIIGMPVVRQGNIIHLPNQALEVAEACSGMRSLVSLMALGAIYAYLSQKRLSAKIILFVSAVPIAVISNVFRVFLTSIFVYTTDLTVTEEPFHSIMGAMVFVVAFILLFIFGAILRRIFK